jgi:hypothetical protein
MNNIDILSRIITALQNDVERLKMGIARKITIPTDGYFVPKVVSSDPVSPQTNEVWINSTSKTIKWFDGTTTYVWNHD